MVYENKGSKERRKWGEEDDKNDLYLQPVL